MASAFICITKNQKTNDHSLSILARARSFCRGTGYGLLLFLSDDAGRRRYPSYERDRTLCTQRCDGLSGTTVQGCGYRLCRALCIVCLHVLRTECAEPMGAIRIPHRWSLLGSCRILRHEDGYLRFCPYCQCCS